MFLRSLTLENLRCYERAEFDFAPGLNVVLGPNASGKTTVVEAIYLLATTTSPRAGHARSMVRHGEAWARVAGVFDAGGREFTMAISLGDPSSARSGSKTIEVDGRQVASVREALGRVQAVLFWVGELEVAKGPPSARRRFMNTAIGQTSLRYLDDLARYRRALRQRNELLKRMSRGGEDGRMLAPWTTALVEAAVPITLDRDQFVRALAVEAAVLHRRLGAGSEELRVCYDPSVALCGDETAVEAALYERLEQTHAREMERGSTQVGPHRDDVSLEVDGVDVRRFGSQGQQRTAALALTLAQARVARGRTDTEPILLLDDCLSELDASRAGAMLDLSADGQQMVVTSACCPEQLAQRLDDAHVICTGEDDGARDD